MKDHELTYRNFVQQLLDEVPEFTPMYKEHVEFNNGEILPHVLLGDFVRFLFGTYKAISSDATNTDQGRLIVQRSLELMERAIVNTDEELQNLIGVSFVE